jgi:hypothetical protein
LDLAKELLIHLDNVFILDVFEDIEEYTKIFGAYYKKLNGGIQQLTDTRTAFKAEGAVKFWYHKYQLQHFRRLLGECVKTWKWTMPKWYRTQFTGPGEENQSYLYVLLTKMQEDKAINLYGVKPQSISVISFMLC